MRTVLIVALALSLASCKGRRAGGDPDATPVPGARPTPMTPQDTAAFDSELLKQARSGADAVIARANDCAAVKEGLEEARAALQKADDRARTDPGHLAIRELQIKLESVAKNCP